ncbi:folate-binding protein [Thioclava sp. GXIMD4216]|uniref:Folate-binding protein n=1 Tax=Thioclava litoralis TaxID=3076557 RepID=A0ABZ1E2L7_9RHOB|nr:folate-binding protein [Thioclava sp. FTW29]
MSQRRIYKISGPDREHFLQGLVSNDVTRLKDGPVYAALLTPQGKYLADFLLVPWGEEILLDIDAGLAEATVRRLMMYKLRAKAEISETDLKLYRGTSEVRPDGAVMDPRHPALGWRLYGETEGDDGSDFDAIRVEHCIPETGIELTPDTFILEAGFERLHGVDFRKGCYVGQEVTARMKHKTELRKGLVRVAITGHAAPGTEIRAGEKPAGVLFTQSGGYAIAYLRLDRAGAQMRAGDALVSYG